MVETHYVPPASHPMLHSVAASLQQLANHTLTSQRLVQLAEDFYWALMEGDYGDDRSPEANQLRETLADITLQWESLVGNLHEQSNVRAHLYPEFPSEWIHHWLEQVQSIEKRTMPETPKNQPAFHIQQVGTINTGDVTIHGDQVGVQHNYASEQNLAEAAKEIQQLLDQLAQTYPTATEAEKSIAVKQIEQQPEMKARVVNALEKGSKKALEKLVDHPAMAIAIAVYEGWKEGKKQ